MAEKDKKLGPVLREQTKSLLASDMQTLFSLAGTNTECVAVINKECLIGNVLLTMLGIKPGL